MSTLTHDSTHDSTHGRLGAGVGFALVSAISFGMSGALARGLMDAGWSAATAVAMRVLVAAVVLLPPAVVALRGRWSLVRRHAVTIAAFGLIGVAGCQLAYFNAVAHMQVGVALLIEYTAPVVVIGWLWLRTGERPGRTTVVGAVVAGAGLVLVLDLLSGADLSLVGVLWALGAMLAVSFYFVIAAGDDSDLQGIVLAAGGLVVGGLALLGAGLLGLLPWSLATAPVRFQGLTMAWWVPVLLLGVVTAAVAYVTGIAAVRRLGSRLASFVALVEVLSALAWAWLLLGELPRPVQVAGGLLIVAGVVLVKQGERGTTVATELPEAQAVSARPAA